MASKKQNRTLVRRRVRRAENRNIREDAPSRDKNIGRACRRGWGAGVALK